MAHEAISTRRSRTPAGQAGERSLSALGRIGARLGPAASTALAVALLTRALVAAIAALAATSLGAEGIANQATYDIPALTAPFEGLGEALLTPLARWDAVWYLAIARYGYDFGSVGAELTSSAAFFPLYPLLIRAFAGAGLVSSPGALLLSAYAVSLASFAGALYLLHRLVELELGRPFARPTLLLLALFPGALYFGAPYSESIFLLVSVGAFYAARQGRFAIAGGLAGAAAATRSAGILLLVPLAILYLYGPRADREEPRPDKKERRAHRRGGLAAALRPRYRPRANIAWLALAPAGLAAYSVYLEIDQGDAFAYMHLQEAWFREFAGPFGGVWDGAVAAFEGARQLLSGSRETVFFERAGGDPFRVAAQNLTLFAFLVGAAMATVGTLRRLPAAYGAYVLAALALPLSFPAGPQPLMSLPRFLAVLFPLFMWLGLVCVERRRTTVAIAAFGAVLALFTAQFASWQWVA